MIPKRCTSRGVVRLAVVVAVAVSPVGVAGSASGGQAELQAGLDRAVGLGIPGAIVVVRDGGGTVRAASGYGDVSRRTPIRTTDRFRVGGLTKTFVATVVLQLVGEGRLSLADSVERWLPGLVPNGGDISVRRLLNMRAGLYNFAPGASWSYCHSCYILLGLIVEKATGRTIGAELERRIFEPLQLRGTSFDTEPLIAGRHSRGYVPVGKRLRDVSVASPSPAWAAGAIVSTADDVERFFSALNQGRLLPARLLREMRTPTESSGGYGLGYARVQAPCATLWGNNGNFVGYNASAWGTGDGKWQLVLFVNLDESALTPRLNHALNQVLIKPLCSGR
jgi:D-alanyl-D-alanine carboxypeptidase